MSILERTSSRKCNSSSMDALLKSNIHIPPGQRGYEWTDENIQSFFTDLLSYKNNGILNYYLGSMLILVGKKRFLWDGQQRTITINIILKAIIKFLKKTSDKETLKQYNVSIKNIEFLLYQDKIDDDESSDSDEDKIETSEELIDDDYIIINKKKYITRLSICLEHNVDNLAYKHIMYDKFKLIDELFVNVEDEKLNKYKCLNCGSIIANTELHLKSCKNIKNKQLNEIYKEYYHKSLIYKSFIKCYEEVAKCFDEFESVKDRQDIIDLLTIHSDVSINEFTNFTEATRAFNLENRRGKSIENSSFYRCILMTSCSNLNEEQMATINSNIKKLDERQNTLKYFNLEEEQIFITAGRIYVNNYEDINILSIFENKSNCNTFDPNEFLTILHKIYNDLDKVYLNNFYVRLLSMIGCIEKETIYHLLIPVLYSSKKLLSEHVIIKLYTYNLIMNINQTNRHFNIQQTVKKLLIFGDQINKMVESSKIEPIFDALFPANMDDELDILEENIKNLSFKKNKTTIKKILYLLNYHKSNTTWKDATDIDIEHIIPQNNNDIDEKDLHNIGNLTLLSGKTNKTTNVKGNKALSNLNYNKKLIAYKDSGIHITTDIANKYPLKFTKTEINIRSTEIAKEITSIITRDYNHKTDYKTKTNKTNIKTKK
jgi:hypothetical protein